MRFRIRSMLIFIALVAVGLALAPSLLRYYRWSDARPRLLQWAAQLERKPSISEAWEHIVRHRDGSVKYYVVSTSELVREIDGNGEELWCASGRRPPDPSRFYVVPPGKWVDSIDEVIRVWDDNIDNPLTQ